MARGDRKLTDFDEVATVDVESTDENNENQADQPNKTKEVNQSTTTTGNLLDTLVSGQPVKKPGILTNKTGIYLDDEVFEILMSLSEKGGRGAKSRIINDALRKEFKDKGLLK